MSEDQVKTLTHKDLDQLIFCLANTLSCVLLVGSVVVRGKFQPGEAKVFEKLAKETMDTLGTPGHRLGVLPHA